MVHSHAVVSFAFQYAHDAERQLLEADHPPYGILAAGEKVIRHRLPDHAYLGGGLYVLIAEHIAILHLVSAYLHIIRADTVDGGRGVVRPVDGLPATVHGGRGGGDVAGLVHDVLVVL